MGLCLRLGFGESSPLSPELRLLLLLLFSSLPGCGVLYSISSGAAGITEECWQVPLSSLTTSCFRYPLLSQAMLAVWELMLGSGTGM